MLHGHDHDAQDADPAAFTQEFWDARYAAHDRVWSGQPNQRLVEVVDDLPPGRAMDIGCGEGADVVWLAERGWRVVGVDVSAVALDKARRHAGEAGVADRTEWARVDLLRAEALPGDADLVTAMYLHLPAADFDATYAAIAAAVRPGGTLLVVGHHPDDAATDLRNPQLSHLLFGPDQVARVLAAIGGWRLEVAEARRREVEKDGEPRIATDTVVVARRERD